MYLSEKLSHLETVLDKNAFKLLVDFTDGISEQHASVLLESIVRTIDWFEAMLKSDDVAALHYSIKNIFASVSQLYDFGTARNVHNHICQLIVYYKEQDYLKVSFNHDVMELLERDLSKPLFEKYKQYSRNNISSPKNTATAAISTMIQEHDFSPEVKERLNCIKNSLNDDAYEMLLDYLSISSIARKTRLTHMLVMYIDILKNGLNTKSETELVRAFEGVRVHVCQNHTYKSAVAKFAHIRSFIRHLIDTRYIEETKNLPLSDLLETFDEEFYLSMRLVQAPKEFVKKAKKELSANEVFLNTLRITCPEDIAKRLIEHVDSFKMKKHHRAPLNSFLLQVFEADSKWYTNQNIIQGELLKYRGNLLDTLQRNSAYGQFQNVKNAMEVLISHGLLPSDTHLPDNLRRCTNTEKIRSANPLLSSTDIYDENKKQAYVNSPKFIQHLTNELSTNLLALKLKAQEIVFAGYHKFLDKPSVIRKSVLKEHISCPQLFTEHPKSLGPLSNNPFHRKHPLRIANLTAYYDYHFDSFLKGGTPHKVSGLEISNEILGHLGLTTLIASAMQAIITEQVGVNPYSLYNIKVQSDGHGQEFIQIDDTGSVRLKTLKPRARMAQSRVIAGEKTPLFKVSKEDIDAAVCIKMALEMTSRTRKSLGVNQLWTCLSTKGVTVGSADSAQVSFQNLRKELGKDNPVLLGSTLKKIRTTKGVLIYLKTNGNSLETAKYLGNTVKTTLNRYVPPYLTELIYRIKIRNFQDVLLFMAISQEAAPSTILRLSKSELESKLVQAFNNPDMGGNLYDCLSIPPKEFSEEGEVYFCVSEQNIQLAIEYARSGDDHELRERCIAALRKIAQGPVIMKQLLRKAQITLDKEIGDLDGKATS